MFTLAICPILMAIHKLFSKILLMQTYHTTCVSYSCQLIKKSQVPVISCMQNTQKQTFISTLVLKLESHTLKLIDMTHRTLLRPGSHSVESDHLI